MHPDIDRQTLLRSKAKDADGNPIPHGYVLPNGVVVVWRGGTVQNNYVNMDYAKAAHSNLVVVTLE